MCDCIKDLETRLRDKLSGPDEMGKLKPKGGVLKYLMPAHMALLFDSGKTALQIPFEATWELPNGKRKEINVPILASHCPFCGVSVEQPKSDNNALNKPHE